MFIAPHASIRFFAPAERNAWFDVFIYQYIALRWSAEHWGGREVYKHLAPLEPKYYLVASKSDVLSQYCFPQITPITQNS